MTQPTPPIPSPPPILLQDTPVLETERSLVAYVDSRMQHSDKMNSHRFDKQDEMLVELVKFMPEVRTRLEGHDDDIKELKGRPLKLWQIIASVVGSTSIVFNIITLVIHKGL